MHRVYTAALYLTRNQSEAEDLLQDTYLRAFRFFATFKPGTNLRAWLLTILYNLVRNRYRARGRHEGRIAPGADGDVREQLRALADGAGSDPAALALDGLVDGEIEIALRNLPYDFRAVVVLVDLQELSYGEAAWALGCPIGTVRSRLARARRLLQVTLHDLARGRGLVRD
jgi:RNA polymerase sigma-70 factor (ECF subfamily)